MALGRLVVRRRELNLFGVFGEEKVEQLQGYANEALIAGFGEVPSLNPKVLRFRTGASTADQTGEECLPIRVGPSRSAKPIVASHGVVGRSLRMKLSLRAGDGDPQDTGDSISGCWTQPRNGASRLGHGALGQRSAALGTDR